MRSASGPRLSLASVLVVEDDEAIADALIDVLEDAGYLPNVVRTLAEARKAIDTDPPRLVVLDLTLEAEFGGDLLDELSTRPDAPPVVIVSAFGLATMVGERYRVPVVSKPFGLDELLDTIGRALDGQTRPQKTA
jgi:DNA-binding NtrC family response regulator